MASAFCGSAPRDARHVRRVWQAVFFLPPGVPLPGSPDNSPFFSKAVHSLHALLCFIIDQRNKSLHHRSTEKTSKLGTTL